MKADRVDVRGFVSDQEIGDGKSREDRTKRSGQEHLAMEDEAGAAGEIDRSEEDPLHPSKQRVVNLLRVRS